MMMMIMIIIIIIIIINFRDCTGVKRRQFETGNIWSEKSPYPHRRRYLVLGSSEESGLWKRKRWFVWLKF
jgi:hypothetical protein